MHSERFTQKALQLYVMSCNVYLQKVDDLRKCGWL